MVSKVTKARVRGARAMNRTFAAVAPIGIAGAAITAGTEAWRSGGSIRDAMVSDTIDTVKSYATYGVVQSGGAAALMYGAKHLPAAMGKTVQASMATAARVGMTAARANLIVSAGMMAYGAGQGAMEARKEGRSMLKGAAQGAWEWSLPGMIYQAGKDTYDGVKDYRQAQRDDRARFDRENAAWQKGKGTPYASSGETFERTRRDPRSGKTIHETVRKPKRDSRNPDWDIGIDPKAED